MARRMGARPKSSGGPASRSPNMDPIPETGHLCRGEGGQSGDASRKEPVWKPVWKPVSEGWKWAEDQHTAAAEAEWQIEVTAAKKTEGDQVQVQAPARGQALSRTAEATSEWRAVAAPSPDLVADIARSRGAQADSLAWHPVLRPAALPPLLGKISRQRSSHNTGCQPRPGQPECSGASGPCLAPPQVGPQGNPLRSWRAVCRWYTDAEGFRGVPRGVVGGQERGGAPEGCVAVQAPPNAGSVRAAVAALTAARDSLSMGRGMGLVRAAETLDAAARQLDSLALEVSQAGGVDPLIALLKCEHALIARHASSALFHLSLHSPVRCALLRHRALLPSLAELLLTCGARKSELGGNTHIAAARANGAALLRCLCSVEGAPEQLLVAGAVPALLRTLKDGGEQEREEAAMCFASLAADAECRSVIAQSSVIAALCQLRRDGLLALDAHTAEVFAMLAKCPKGGRALASQEPLQLLADILESSPADTVREHVLSAVAGALRHSPVVKGLVLETGLSIAVDELTRHSAGSVRDKAAILMDILYEP